MDIKTEFTEPCPCGKDIAGVSGRCAECHRKGAEAFWAFIDGKISFAGMMRRLRR